jgi:H+/gluconate symporter-like permease
MTGILVIVAALAALMYFAYRGVSLLLLAPGLAVLAVALAGDGPMLATYTQVFMEATGGFVIQYFPLFLLGAVFGKLMEASGSARVLGDEIIRRLGAGRAILAVILSCAAMTYGGVSLFVVAFAVYPIAAALFREANLPKVLIPATIALGAFTFTMTALPGTPAIQNAIPMPFFGTTPFAAPGLGIITGAIMLGLGWLYLERRASTLGPGYGEDRRAETVVMASEDRPAFILAALPLVLVIAVNLLFTFVVIPAMDTDFLAQPPRPYARRSATGPASAPPDEPPREEDPPRCAPRGALVHRRAKQPAEMGEHVEMGRRYQPFSAAIGRQQDRQ